MAIHAAIPLNPPSQAKGDDQHAGSQSPITPFHRKGVAPQARGDATTRAADAFRGTVFNARTGA
jgi:hypothetical protein